MLVGAYDPGAWTGLVFCTGPGRGFAFRFALEHAGRRYDGYDFMDIVREVGPCAPDGSYARMAFDPLGDTSGTARTMDSRIAGLIIEWSSNNEQALVGRVQTNLPVVLELRAYFPWDWSGTWTPLGGESATDSNRITLVGRDSGACDELHVSLFRDAQGHVPDRPPDSVVQDGACLTRFSMNAGDSLLFEAVFSQRGDRPAWFGIAEASKAAATRLSDAEERYAGNRVTTEGHWEGLAASITNNLHWMVALKPEEAIRYTPAGRKWIFPRFDGGRDHWTVFCWDAFLNALELAVESQELARDTLRAVLDTQYGNGNIPNWRGRYFGTPDRSQPPVGSLVALKLYLRTGDRSLLKESFPVLDRWSQWWRAPKGNGMRRDGNGNGLFEWGCDVGLLRHSPARWENEATHHQLAAWESGQDDLPNWDDAIWMSDTETLDLESVDLNSLIALDYDCLRTIAEELDLSEKAEEYGRLYDQLEARVNEQLWSEERGMYMDRHWDGRSSNRIAASHFYPLVAGIVPRARAERMLETLLDESKFWGRYVLPTISRDDPAFTDQQYWRGTIWPPTNYLVYQGLKRYRFDDAAARLAQRSVELFLGSWRSAQVCRENYDSRTGEGGGQKYQSWGPLFALTGIEEFIDVTPWDGIRVGTPSPPQASTLDRIRILGREWKVRLAPSGLEVSIDGEHLLTATEPIVLRHLAVAADTMTAEVETVALTTLEVSLGASELAFTMDGRATICPASSLQLPPGKHTIRITRAVPA